MNGFKSSVLSYDWKKLFIIFLVIWVGLNLFQALFTEVMSDEAYYSMYGEALAWGYYDHPPMVGLMTFLSDLIFGGNLSVRFMTIVFQFFTLILIWKLVGEKSANAEKIILFFIISASFIMFRAYGFVTAPDVPFLFFTALFLFIYKRFLESESWGNSALLALAMAGMFYSKYHAVLIIGLIVLSNLRILTRYKFWMAGLLALVFLLPHIYWQVSMDFPGFQYHLSDRSSSFKWRYFWEYLPNQLAVFNPFTFVAIIYIFVKYRAKDVFERGLYFLTIGFIVFFWLMSFRGHVEPHWTVACSIPMIILLYRRSLENPRLMRYVKRWIAPSLILIFIVRILLISDVLPEKFGFHGKKERSEAIETIAGDLPVVFTGSFQNPSNYHFFTRKEAFVLSGANSRATQYDIWQREQIYQGRPALICQNIEGKSKEYVVGEHTIWAYKTEDFQSVNRIKIDYLLNEREVSPGDTLRIVFEIFNPTAYDKIFDHQDFPVRCRVGYATNARKGRIGFFECELNEPIGTLYSGARLRRTLSTVVPDIQPGEYQFTITLDNTICPARNSKFVSLKIN